MSCLKISLAIYPATVTTLHGNNLNKIETFFRETDYTIAASDRDIKEIVSCLVT